MTPIDQQLRDLLDRDEMERLLIRYCNANDADHWEAMASDVEPMDDDLVFVKRDASWIHPDIFSQIFDNTVARLDVPALSLHDLRHAHATLLLKRGVHVKVVSLVVHLEDPAGGAGELLLFVVLADGAQLDVFVALARARARA